MKLEVQFQIKERDDPTKKNILILLPNFVQNRTWDLSAFHAVL